MKTKVLLVGSTPEVMNLMHMALAEDVRFDVAGATSDPADVLDNVKQLALDAIVFHETDRSRPEWVPVFDALQSHHSDVELVELAAESQTVIEGDEARQIAAAEVALSIGNTVALLLRSKRSELA